MGSTIPAFGLLGLYNCVAAALLVGGGIYAFFYLQKPLVSWLSGLGIPRTKPLASMVLYFILLTAIVAALNQLGIAVSIVQRILAIAFAGFAMTAALALGLGSKDVVSGFVAGHFLRQRIQVGDNVQVGELQGRVREIGSVATIVETEEEGLAHRHSVPNVRMLNEAIR